MNNLLEVKVRYNREGRKSGPIRTNLRTHDETTIEKIDTLESNLRGILKYYDNTPRLIDGFLIDVNYNDIIAKSKRISELLKASGKQTNEDVVGARFSNAPEGQENHIITHYVDRETVLSYRVKQHRKSLMKMKSERIPWTIQDTLRRAA